MNLAASKLSLLQSNPNDRPITHNLSVTRQSLLRRDFGGGILLLLNSTGPLGLVLWSRAHVGDGHTSVSELKRFTRSGVGY